MIDTIRFKIPLKFDTYTKIREKSIEITKYNNATEFEFWKVSTTSVNLGSFDHKINIFIPDSETCFIEFSVPKYLNGHNVFLISFKEFLFAISKLHKSLVELFNGFPDPIEWEIMRIDLCYAWKFLDQQGAEEILAILQTFDFPKKKKSIYDTSVMYIGASYSLKFYLKNPEYFKHDFKILRDNDFLNLAYQQLEISKGVLRFEVSLRKKYLKYHLNINKLYLNSPCFTEDKLWYIIKSLFNEYMGHFHLKYSSKANVKRILTRFYGHRKGSRLYMFWIFLVSEGKSSLKSLYASSTVYEYLRDLRKAEVPLSYDDLKSFDISLSIPSSFVVNKSTDGGSRSAI